MNNKTLVFVADKFTCIDEVRLGSQPPRSRICAESLEQVRKRYPGAYITELGPWLEAKEKALCTQPQPITEERFMEMLEVLPPQRWQHGKDCESFELCEHTSGRVTAIFCRFGNQYFEFQGIAGQSLAAHATHCGQMKGKP